MGAEFLAGGLDRLLQFFLCPSFALDMVEREVRAIDSEHRNNMPKDAWRLSQIFKAGLNPAHPAAGFSTGNLATLLGPARPAAALHAALVAFHERWYVGPRMTLGVVGREPLDELEAMAGGFAAVRRDRSRGRPGSHDDGPGKAPRSELRSCGGSQERASSVRRGGPRFAAAAGSSGGAFGAGSWCRGVRRRVVPVQDVRELTLVFPLPGRANLETKPHRYLSHTLGHEGEGSLHAALQGMGLVEDLSAGAEMQ